VIYSARRIVSDRTHLRYDLIDDCGRTETRSSAIQSLHHVNTLTVVPNPATDQVTLKMNNGSSGTIVMQSMNGIEVFRTDVSATDQYTIQTETMQSGVYIVSFISIDGEVSTTKVLIVD